MISHDDLLVLLEDGPKSSANLAKWLRTQPGAVFQTLRAIAKKTGAVKTVGPQRLWALASYTGDGSEVLTTPPESGPSKRSTAPRADTDEVSDLFDDQPPDEDAVLAEELLQLPTQRRAGRPRLRQEVATSARVTGDRPPAWWVGKSREQLNAEAHAKAPTMSASPEARKLTASQYPVW